MSQHAARLHNCSLRRLPARSQLVRCFTACAHIRLRRSRTKRCSKQPVRKARHCSTATCALAVAQNSLLGTAQTSPWRDSLALGTALVGAVVWVKIFEKLAQSGFLDQVRPVQTPKSDSMRIKNQAQPGLAVQKLSRKLVHISSGPLFILTWPLFRCDCKHWPHAHAALWSSLASVQACLDAYPSTVLISSYSFKCWTLRCMHFPYPAINDHAAGILSIARVCLPVGLSILSSCPNLHSVNPVVFRFTAQQKLRWYQL